MKFKELEVGVKAVRPPSKNIYVKEEDGSATLTLANGSVIKHYGVPRDLDGFKYQVESK